MPATSPLLVAGPPLVIGHRGAAAVRPENTIPSFAHALSLGVDGVEFDVRLTRDGAVVVHHDADTARTCGERHVVAESTLATLRTLDAGATFRGAEPAPRATRIPTLDEALELLRDVPLIVECKTVEVARPAIAVLRRHGLAGRTIVGSFLHGAMAVARAEGVASAASRTDMLALCLRAWTGLAPRRLPMTALAIPERSGGLPLPLPRLVTMTRPLGVPVHVWTVNDPADARRLWDMGVTGLLSDDPRTLLATRALRAAGR